MANNQSSSIMSAGMNMAITIFGFVLSALFIMVICCRLLCSRFRQSSNPLDMFQTDRRSMGSFSIEPSLQGLERSVVTCFPTIKYNQQIFTSNEDNLCTICLGDYKEKEVLRILPRCGHAFHVSCIDVWLRQHYTCPVCRISLRIFSEWRQISGPLISLLAKPRFVPGALPDYLFEQPKNFRSVPVGLPTRLSKESLGWPVIVEDRIDLEMGESSHHASLGLIEGEQESGDMQQLLEGRLNVASDSASHCETLVRQANTPATDRMAECGNGCIPNAPREEKNAEIDTSAVRSQAGGLSSAQICSIDEKGSIAQEHHELLSTHSVMKIN